ncbi:hypothetical protein [Proteus vulgaris]|uniref:Uncharacterized protein n=1 Tax=Proteus vulgaris TaxID=585 RepID=A0A6G6SJA3_PROVU|nr:hypothetical protein [Proteus vulgaris]QIF93139.1 hypothetical protein GTH24_04150 [Proteus vulgaris]WIF73134.1 hypothetical protein QN092_04365 [Proteus vulgaris]CRL65551.1 hypothetical protein BN1805_03405 [Proteus vulgaris]
MKKDELVISEIYKELFEDNLKLYSERLNRQVQESQNRGTSSQVNKFFVNLSEKERQLIINMLKIAMTDTASIIFGTLDGTHFVNNINKDFQLIYDDEEIQGDLQDHFLALVEDNNR